MVSSNSGVWCQAYPILSNLFKANIFSANKTKKRAWPLMAVFNSVPVLAFLMLNKYNILNK